MQTKIGWVWSKGFGKQYVPKSLCFFIRYFPEHLQAELAEDRPEVLSRGGSVIVSPLGEVLAGPLYGRRYFDCRGGS